MTDTHQSKPRSVVARFSWVVFLLPLLFLGYIIVDNTVFRQQVAALPDCDDEQMVVALHDDLETSLASVSGSGRLRVTDIYSRSGDTDTLRTCAGTLVMDDGETVPLNYNIQAQDDGDFALSFELQS